MERDRSGFPEPTGWNEPVEEESPWFWIEAGVLLLGYAFLMLMALKTAWQRVASFF